MQSLEEEKVGKISEKVQNQVGKISGKNSDLFKLQEEKNKNKTSGTNKTPREHHPWGTCGCPCIMRGNNHLYKEDNAGIISKRGNK